MWRVIVGVMVLVDGLDWCLVRLVRLVVVALLLVDEACWRIIWVGFWMGYLRVEVIRGRTFESGEELVTSGE